MISIHIHAINNIIKFNININEKRYKHEQIYVPPLIIN